MRPPTPSGMPGQQAVKILRPHFRPQDGAGRAVNVQLDAVLLQDRRCQVAKRLQLGGNIDRPPALGAA
jgi:hypothetical protein